MSAVFFVVFSIARRHTILYKGMRGFAKWEVLGKAGKNNSDNPERPNVEPTSESTAEPLFSTFSVILKTFKTK